MASPICPPINVDLVSAQTGGTTVQWWQFWKSLDSRIRTAAGLPINVLTYGADPTGLTDSTAAFLAALTAATDGGFGAVYAPGGQYLLGQITLPAGVMLYGDGEATVLIRNATIATGEGWFDLPNAGAVLWRLYLDGQVTTPTGLQYGTGTSGVKFNNDPMNAKLTDNTSVWIHPGADYCKVIDCSIRHTGGYAILLDSRTGNLDQIVISGNLIENNRPHLFGTTLGQLIYGSWTGGIHGQGNDNGNTYTLSNCLVTENRISRTTGIGIYIEHAYGFDAQATTVTISNNILETIGLDGIELGNCTGFVISGNNLRRGGVTTLTDSDSPVPRYLANAYAVGIDTSGLAQYGMISGNSVLNWNGACYDHDGLCDSGFEGNNAALSQPGEPAYSEDNVANFGLGAGPICYGMQTSNTQLNNGGENVAITGNTFRGMTSGAIRIYCGRNCTVTGNTIWHPAAPFSPPMLIGNTGTTTAKRSANVNVFGNTIYYSPSGQAPCIVEDQSLGTFGGTEPNYVWGNRCIGNCYEFLAAASSNSSTLIGFPSNSASLSARQDFQMQNTGVDVSTAFRFYTYEGATQRQMGQWNNYRSLTDRDSIFNVSLAGGTSTGIISTGDWVTFGFGNIMATGWNFNRGAYVALDYQNAYSDFSDAKANLLTDDYALLYYKKGTGWLQSISTSAGARVWSGFGGGTPGSPNLSVQFNNSGSFGGDAGWLALFDATSSISLLAATTDPIYYANVDGSTSGFGQYKARRGDATHPVLASAQLMRIASEGWDSSGSLLYGIGPSIDMFATSNWTPSNAESYITFKTVPNGSITPAERMRITPAGAVYFNRTTNDGTGALVQVSGGISASANVYVGRTSDDGSGAVIQITGTGRSAGGGTTTGWTGPVIQGENTGANITFQNSNSNFSVNGNGDVSAVGVGYFTGSGILCGTKGVGAAGFNPYNSGSVTSPASYYTGQSFSLTVNVGTGKLRFNGVDVNSVVFVGGVVVGTT